MKKLGVLYTVLMTVATISALMLTVALYRSGSETAPGWATFLKPGTLSAAHAFLGEKCEACHTPIRGVQAVNCIACHATAAATLAKQPTAFHASTNDCRGCHAEHAGASRPTRMDHAALLRLGSHRPFGRAGPPSATSQIVDDLAGFVGIRISGSAEQHALDCSSCHSNQDPHRQLFGRECAACHDTSGWRIAQFLHPSPASKDCAQCHQAPPSHYMMHFEMVSMHVAGQMHAQVNHCYLCHKTNAFNDIKGRGWYKHH